MFKYWQFAIKIIYLCNYFVLWHFLYSGGNFTIISIFEVGTLSFSLKKRRHYHEVSNYTPKLEKALIASGRHMIALIILRKSCFDSIIFSTGKLRYKSRCTVRFCNRCGLTRKLNKAAAKWLEKWFLTLADMSP